MIEWLRRAGPGNPGHGEQVVDVAGRALPLRIRRHARATRMTMRLAPDGSEVRITLPQWGRSGDAMSFVHSRKDWLAQQLARVPQAAPPAPGGTLLYRGTPHPIDWHAAHPRSPRLHEGRLCCGGPAEGLPGRLARWLAAEGQRLMSDDLAFYCARGGVAVPALRLSSAKRRWGSCSSSGTVRINWRLVQAPDAVRRSVVAHEVAHLLHFDHSPAFHSTLAGLFEGDLPAADRWLKAHGRGLYASFG